MIFNFEDLAFSILVILAISVSSYSEITTCPATVSIISR